MCDFSLVIPTRDRWSTFGPALEQLASWFPARDEVIVYDDASREGPPQGLLRRFPQVECVSGRAPIGRGRARNLLFARARGRYVVSLDDDIEVLTSGTCETLRQHFQDHPRCGIVSFRTWWSTAPLRTPLPAPRTGEQAYACNDFLAGACAMRNACFADSGGYAEWIQEYGEETYVAIQAFRRGWDVHYVPSIFVRHRGAPAEERNDSALLRHWLRHQLFNQLAIVATHFPARVVPLRGAQLMAHYLWHYGVRRGLARECASTFVSFTRRLVTILRERAPLSLEEYRRWQMLPAPVYYWTPDGR